MAPLQVLSVFVASFIFMQTLGNSQTCPGCFTRSRAAHYPNSEEKGTENGSCEFGTFGATINGGDVSAASELYRNGLGCGACYQVRCTDSNYCSDKGVTIVITDHGSGDRTDFILSQRAFARMAQTTDAAGSILALGVVDIEYRRYSWLIAKPVNIYKYISNMDHWILVRREPHKVPIRNFSSVNTVSCTYPDKNITIQIEESSNNPHYLAFVIWYQQGKSDITAVQLCETENFACKLLDRTHGAVWTTTSPPRGPLQIRMLLSADDGDETWAVPVNNIPENWKAGDTYDSGIQVDA